MDGHLKCGTGEVSPSHPANGCQRFETYSVPQVFHTGMREVAELEAHLLLLSKDVVPPGLPTPISHRTMLEVVTIGPPPGLEFALQVPPGTFAGPFAGSREQPMKVEVRAPATSPIFPELRARSPTCKQEKPRQQFRRRQPAREACRATLVLAYFPRAASEEDICRVLDRATGRANCVRRCHVVRTGGLYGVFEFADEGLAELALEACGKGRVVLKDCTCKKWYLHASRSRHVTVSSGKPVGQKGRAPAAPVQEHSQEMSDDHQEDSDASTAPSSGRC